LKTETENRTKPHRFSIGFVTYLNHNNQFFLGLDWFGSSIQLKFFDPLTPYKQPIGNSISRFTPTPPPSRITTLISFVENFGEALKNINSNALGSQEMKT
jgi:hypothetical protein